MPIMEVSLGLKNLVFALAKTLPLVFEFENLFSDTI